MNSTWQKIQIWFNRFLKKIHPLQVRKDFKFRINRSSKYVSISKKLGVYVDTLMNRSESAESALAINAMLRSERSEMFVPYSEARFLEFFLKSISAKKALEIGVFKGFSTAFLARALPEDGIVFACDKDVRQLPTARKFWKQMNVDEKIHFELGNAVEVLEKMTQDEPSLGYFDIAFIDADKENYKKYFEYALKLVKKGGVILIDNTLWKGLVEYDEPHDNGAMHIKDLNEFIFGVYKSSAVMIPTWDGITAVMVE